MEQLRNRNYQRVDKLIIDGFCELLKNGSEKAVTITALCEKAGVNRTTFYKHYRGTWEIVEKLEEELIQGINGDKPNLIEFLKNPYPRFQELNKILEHNIVFYKRLFTSQHIESLSSKINSMIVKNNQKDPAVMKAFNNDINRLKIAIDINIGVIIHLYLSWFKNEYSEASLDDVAQSVSHAIQRMADYTNIKE